MELESSVSGLSRVTTRMSSRSVRRHLGLVGTILVFSIIILWFIGFNNPRWGFMPGVKKSRPGVTLRQGNIIGFQAEADEEHPQILEQFLGVPYALSTDGQRRFRPPVPVAASEDDFDAGQYGARCPSGSNDGIPQSEACLNLNIFRPKVRDENEKLPVLVYIHGGAFNAGAGHSRQISSLVAWSSNPMIGISFNYRVGAFGFLSSSLASKESLLNAGLKDQNLLFKWVQENIAAFGGDTEDITIMGASAGAHSVCRSSLHFHQSLPLCLDSSAFRTTPQKYLLEKDPWTSLESSMQKLTPPQIGHHLMHNPDNPPLFHKAILESGAATARAVYRYDHALHEKQFQEFLSQLNLQNVPDDHIFYTLQTLSTSQIKRASEAIFNKYNPSVRWPWQPVIDGPGGMIPIAPIKAWRSGKWHKIPILTGFNTNEGARFVPSTLSKSAQFAAFFRALLPGLSDEDLKTLDEVYPDPVSDPTSKYVEKRKGLGAQFKRVEQTYAHFAYIAPVRQTADFASEGPAPVYLYHFAVNSSVRGGADHGDHSRFVTYNKEIRDISPTLNEISGTMHAYWTSFITTGDPNKVEGRWRDRPVWPKYAAGEGKKVVFGEGNDERAGQRNKGKALQVMDDTWAREECEYWWERTEKFEV